MSDFVDEEHCPLCARYWPSERPAFRANLDTIPLKEPICNAFLMVWARNIGFPVSDDDAMKALAAARADSIPLFGVKNRRGTLHRNHFGVQWHALESHSVLIH